MLILYSVLKLWDMLPVFCYSLHVKRCKLTTRLGDYARFIVLICQNRPQHQEVELVLGQSKTGDCLG